MPNVGRTSRGRAWVGAERIPVRMSQAFLRRLDYWIEQHTGPKPTRAEAIRQLVELALTQQTAPTAAEITDGVRDSWMRSP